VVVLVVDKAAVAEKKAAEKKAAERAAAKATAAKAAAESVAQQARIADVADEPLELMGPITGVMKCVRLSLMDAAAASGVEDIDAHAFMASEAGAQLAAADPHGLDADEAGGLWLYTAESDLYPTLNRLLRTRDSSALIPFFPYLQLGAVRAGWSSPPASRSTKSEHAPAVSVRVQQCSLRLPTRWPMRLSGFISTAL
jgi:hypothetical protein